MSPVEEEAEEEEEEPLSDWWLDVEMDASKMGKRLQANGMR